MLGNRLSRARYFRGNGVHSPYIYSIVREVFMRRDLMEGGREIYERLISMGESRKRAVQLQNLALHCGYESYAVNGIGGDVCFLTRDLPRVEVLEIVRQAAELRRTVVMLAPYSGCERLALCRQIIAEHRSTTVDKRAYLLIFNNHLPKQHFRL